MHFLKTSSGLISSLWIVKLKQEPNEKWRVTYSNGGSGFDGLEAFAEGGDIVTFMRKFDPRFEVQSSS